MRHTIVVTDRDMCNYFSKLNRLFVTSSEEVTYHILADDPSICGLTRLISSKSPVVHKHDSVPAMLSEMLKKLDPNECEMLCYVQQRSELYHNIKRICVGSRVAHIFVDPVSSRISETCLFFEDNGLETLNFVYREATPASHL